MAKTLVRSAWTRSHCERLDAWPRLLPNRTAFDSRNSIIAGEVVFECGSSVRPGDEFARIGFMFDVDGRKVEAMELRPGMNLTATKIVESPRTETATDAVVTGVGPKK
jgi:hypothetical protein